MKAALKGFTLFEVLLYLGIFFFMAGALLTFSWNVLDMGMKDRVSRRVFSDERFVSERIKYLIRDASGIDSGASTLDDADGKLVLKRLGSSDTVTIEIKDGVVTLEETGQPDVALHSADTKATELRFTAYGSSADASRYVDVTLGLQSAQQGTGARATYDAATTLRFGASLRNSGL